MPEPPLPDNITSVQPGGGVCYRLELAWGRWRRAYLKRFRRAYVHRMATLRRGDPQGAPHEILDPRDLKYCSNLCSARWDPHHDPFAWRDHLPFTRWGLAELQIMGWPLLALAAASLLVSGGPFRWFGFVPLILAGLVGWFFRNPQRTIPADSAAVVSPADGVIAEITTVEHYDFFDGPAIRIGIFLSIFNVHINRAPRAGKVLAMHYKPGEFLNALDPESALRNEFMWIGCQDTLRPDLKWAVRQISGLIARRIVCALRPGQAVQRGENFGMIKLGSRTELLLPAGTAEISVKIGEKVSAGSTVLATLRD
jgi:phosphatidylserine decarboxylase